MNEPPDQTAEFRRRELVVVLRDDRPEVLLDELLVLAQAGVHVEEEHALLLEILLELVVHDLRLVLGAHAGEVLLLSLGNAELVPRVEDLRRQVLPALRLLLGRADVVVDVLEVDVVQVPAPLRQLPGEEVVERLVPELAHPVGLVLVLGDRLDDLVRDSTAGLEEVVLRLVRVREAVLVLLADLLNGLGLACHQTAATP